MQFFPFSLISRPRPNQLPVHWVLGVLFVGKMGETRCWPPALLWCPCYEWVELYLYSQYLRFPVVAGENFTLPFTVCSNIQMFISCTVLIPVLDPRTFLLNGTSTALTLSTSRKTHRFCKQQVEPCWNVVAHGDAREGKWRGNWRMEWVASTLHTTSKHGVSSITIADAHTSAASSRLNWRPWRFKWTRPFRRKTKSGFCACAVPSHFKRSLVSLYDHKTNPGVTSYSFACVQRCAQPHTCLNL